MQLFYAPDFVSPEYTLSEEESRHAVRVLRFGVGDTLYITDGRGNLFRCEVVSDSLRSCTVRAVSVEREYGRLPYRLVMAVAPTKNIDRFEWFLEKATEIGTAEFVPLECDRSERRTIKYEREEKVITAAVKQSLKAYHPTLHEMTRFRDFVARPFDGRKFIAHCDSPLREKKYLASTLKASALEIWTDVDGFMTADPKVINDAYVIEHLSYVEAMELCNFGAKVIYPPTIFPAYHKNIPIVIRNTFNLDSKGTAISRESSGDASRAIKGISSINDTCLITIQGLGMVGVIGVNYRIFKTLAKSGISVFLVSQAASENTTSIGVRNDDADLAMEVLTEEFAQEIALGEINKIKKEPNLATIAIVGENMKHTPGIAGKLFGTLGRSGINVIACAQGASETNISFVVSLDSLRKTLNVLHDSFFLSDYQVLNIFIAGVGLIGSNLLEQIRLQQAKLMKENSLQIRVVGATNSKRYIVDRDGLDLKTYRDELRRSENVSTPAAFRDAILSMNIFNSVFVDCTASAEVADIYKDLLEHNVSVVAANKTAASSEYDRYHELKSIARKRGVKFLFETNVGAGLPIINTISDLINSGDRILKIEAVVSGTLNYIFNEMSATVPMSKAIKMAQEAGYAEPDPRIDLSGMDVIRKLVILSREAGYRVEQADVKKHLFIPEKYFEGSVEDFWRKIPEIDAEFEQRRKKLEASGKRWRFIATMENGKTEVGLREVDSESPFYHLAGSNNVILLTTERYKEYPMQIKGYGAGAGVTAAGVFADIISIANIR